jgi:hypothetical protein
VRECCSAWEVIGERRLDPAPRLKKGAHLPLLGLLDGPWLTSGWKMTSGQACSCWIALDDMTEANGTAYLLPYSRPGTRHVVKHVRD